MSAMASCSQEGLLALSNAVLADNFCAFEYPIHVSQPQSIHPVFGKNDILVLEQSQTTAQSPSSSSSILVSLVQDLDGDSIPETKRILVQKPSQQQQQQPQHLQEQFTHGLAIHGNYLYAVNETAIHRWQFRKDDETYLFHDDEQKEQQLSPEVFVTDWQSAAIIYNDSVESQNKQTTIIINDKSARSFVVDNVGRVYVSMMSSSSNPGDEKQSTEIHRFQVNEDGRVSGEVFVEGLGTAVALGFDALGTLWGVDSSMTIRGKQILEQWDWEPGDSFHSAELNQLSEEMAGSHYGSPYCTTKYQDFDFSGRGRTVSNRAEYTDDNCRKEFVSPELVIPIHFMIPRDIVFFQWKSKDDIPSGCRGGFPSFMDGYAFVAFSGAAHSVSGPAYKIVYIALGSAGAILHEPVDLLLSDSNAEGKILPTSLSFDSCGRLLVSFKGSTDFEDSKIVGIEYAEFPVHPQELPARDSSSRSHNRRRRIAHRNHGQRKESFLAVGKNQVNGVEKLISTLRGPRINVQSKKMATDISPETKESLKSRSLHLLKNVSRPAQSFDSGSTATRTLLNSKVVSDAKKKTATPSTSPPSLSPLSPPSTSPTSPPSPSPTLPLYLAYDNKQCLALIEQTCSCNLFFLGDGCAWDTVIQNCKLPEGNREIDLFIAKLVTNFLYSQDCKQFP